MCIAPPVALLAQRGHRVVNPAVGGVVDPCEGQRSDTKMLHRRGPETKVAPGPALLPTTIPYGRRGPIPRRGLYTLSATQEQERAENQRRLLKSMIKHGIKDDAR